MVRCAVIFSATAALLASAVTIPELDVTYIKAQTPALDTYFGQSVAWPTENNFFVGAAGIQLVSNPPVINGFVNSYFENAFQGQVTGAPLSNFGFSLAATPTTLVVGAPYDSTTVSAGSDTAVAFATAAGATAGTPTSGGAYIYTINSATGALTLQTLARTGATTANAECGYSVAIEGDVAVFGCPNLVATGYTNGAAYVLTRSGATWSGAILPVPTGAVPATFGEQVAIMSNVIYASDPDTQFVQPYYLASGTWTLGTVLTTPNTESIAFGKTMIARNGYLIVGDPGDSSCTYGVAPTSDACRFAGTVYIFTATPNTGATPTVTADGYVSAPRRVREGVFGSSLALGTVEGQPILYVGSAGDSACGTGYDVESTAAAVPGVCSVTQSGTVYAFRRSGAASWVPAGAVKSLGPAREGAFGTSAVALAENLLVGAAGEGNSNGGINPPGLGAANATNSGAAYRFGPGVVVPVPPSAPVPDSSPSYPSSPAFIATQCLVVCPNNFGANCVSAVGNGQVATCPVGTYAANAVTAAGVTCANNVQISLACLGAPSTDIAIFNAQVLSFTEPALLRAWLLAYGLYFGESTTCHLTCVNNVPTLRWDRDRYDSFAVTRCFGGCVPSVPSTVIVNTHRQVAAPISIGTPGNVIAVCRPGQEREECEHDWVCSGILREGDICGDRRCPDCSSSSKKGLLGLLGLLGLIPLLLCCCCLLWLCCIRRSKTAAPVQFATFDPAVPAAPVFDSHCVPSVAHHMPATTMHGGTFGHAPIVAP